MFHDSPNLNHKFQTCKLLNFVVHDSGLEQWYSTFFVRVPPHIISLQPCTPKVVGA
jgi:hypothetical protein